MACHDHSETQRSGLATSPGSVGPLRASLTRSSLGAGAGGDRQTRASGGKSIRNGDDGNGGERGERAQQQRRAGQVQRWQVHRTLQTQLGLLQDVTRTNQDHRAGECVWGQRREHVRLLVASLASNGTGQVEERGCRSVGRLRDVGAPLACVKCFKSHENQFLQIFVFATRNCKLFAICTGRKYCNQHHEEMVLHLDAPISFTQLI